MAQTTYSDPKRLRIDSRGLLEGVRPAFLMATEDKAGQIKVFHRKWQGNTRFYYHPKCRIVIHTTGGGNSAAPLESSGLDQRLAGSDRTCPVPTTQGSSFLIQVCRFPAAIQLQIGAVRFRSRVQVLN